MNAATLTKANNVFAAFATSAAAHTVSAQHAPIAEVVAALPKAARAPYKALPPVGQVAALMHDDITAVAIFVADGNAYEQGATRFFLSSVALFLRMGDESARQVVRDTWADSKDKRREYALKIFRMCAKAIEAGNLDGVRAVSGFASLAALQPKKEQAEKAAPESVAYGVAGIDGAPIDAAQAERAELVANATSRAADIATTLERMAAVSAAISDAAANAASLDSDTLAAWAGELNTLRASLETLAA